MTSHFPDEREIFNVARRLGTAEVREEYLRKVCGSDEKPRNRVSALIAGYENAASFLEVPAFPVAATLDATTIVEQRLNSVGPYKIREQLAEGGMGVVYLAEQSQPLRRKVALKVIKPGMSTKLAPNEPEKLQKLAPLLLLAGNLEEYQTLCNRLLAEEPKFWNHDHLKKLLRLCLLDPQPANPETLLRLARELRHADIRPRHDDPDNRRPDPRRPAP